MFPQSLTYCYFTVSIPAQTFSPTLQFLQSAILNGRLARGMLK